MNVYNNDDSTEDNGDNNNYANYKGIYNGDDTKKMYYEFGAHFSYRELFKKLNKLIKPDTLKSTSTNSLDFHTIHSKNEDNYENEHIFNLKDDYLVKSNSYKNIPLKIDIKTNKRNIYNNKIINKINNNFHEYKDSKLVLQNIYSRNNMGLDKSSTTYFNKTGFKKNNSVDNYLKNKEITDSLEHNSKANNFSSKTRNLNDNDDKDNKTAKTLRFNQSNNSLNNFDATLFKFKNIKEIAGKFFMKESNVGIKEGNRENIKEGIKENIKGK